MPLTLIPPRPGKTPYYYVRGTIRGGQRIDESTGFKDKARAEDYRIKRENAALNASLYGPRFSAKFSLVALDYAETVKPGRTQLAAIIGAARRDGTQSACLLMDFADMLCSKIDQDAVNRVIKKRFRHAAPATVQRQLLTPLTAVLNWAADPKRKWCDTPHFDRPATPRGRSRWASADEIDRILAAAPPHLYRLVLFLVLTGARLGEVLALRWDDVDLVGRWVVLRNTKRGKRGERAGEDRGVPLHPQLVPLLANLARPKSADGFVFLSSLGRPYAARLGGGHIKTGWAATLKRAGVEGLRVHDLRHSFATWLLMAGVMEETRAKIMGHASSEMTRRYAHVPDPVAIAAVESLPWRRTGGELVDRGYPYPGRSLEKQGVA